MTRKELIERFKLNKTNTKCYFHDGRTEKCRTLYIDRNGNFFTFYNNDLHTFSPYLPYEDGMEGIDGKLGAGYSWYH